jgi:hypothetical protein
MYATLFSLLICFFIIFNPFETNVIPDAQLVGISLIVIASLFVLIQNFALAMAWNPLQNAEKEFTPRIIEVFKRDRLLRFIHFWLLFFPLISYAIAIDLLYLNLFNKIVLLAVWIVFLGIAIDLLSLFFKRILEYINPVSVINQMVNASRQSILQEDEGGLCQWIDALSEVAIKAGQRSSPSLANQALSQLPSILENYFQSAKSIGHQKLDKANYILYYLLQRLEMIFHKALEHRLEPICRFAINIAGKITLLAAKYDITLMTLPLRYLGEFALAGQKAKMGDIGDYAACVLLEVAKKILAEVDVTYLEIRDPFFALISQLEEISKEAFRQDRNINIQVLNQPFGELKALFQTEPLAKHQDTPIILQDIDRVTGEFDALGMVLRTVPPIPKTEEE